MMHMHTTAHKDYFTAHKDYFTAHFPPLVSEVPYRYIYIFLISFPKSKEFTVISNQAQTVNTEDHGLYIEVIFGNRK